MSVWREGSDVLRLNAAAGDQPVPVSADVREVLRVARQVSEWTDGKFDVTFGALSRPVEVRPQIRTTRFPTRSESPSACRSSTTRPSSSTSGPARCSCERKGMRVHLGGIGKGYAVDRAVEILRAAGLRDFMIQAGGDLYVAGRRAIGRGASASPIRGARPTAASRRSICRTAPSARPATTSDSS